MASKEQHSGGVWTKNFRDELTNHEQPRITRRTIRIGDNTVAICRRACKLLRNCFQYRKTRLQSRAGDSWEVGDAGFSNYHRAIVNVLWEWTKKPIPGLVHRQDSLPEVKSLHSNLRRTRLRGKSDKGWKTQLLNKQWLRDGILSVRIVSIETFNGTFMCYRLRLYEQKS